MNNRDNHVRLRLQRAEFDLVVDLDLPAEGITALFGASGSGKTSLLRCVAGLVRAQNGLVRMAGQTWQDDAAGVFLPTWQRSLGYVFQEASLFEHMTVAGNLAYGVHRTAGASGAKALAEAVELLGIGALLPRRPQALSGGERQRVAIARAIATRPRLLLLDEPLASLDQARRRDILPWLARIRDELKTPMLYVTHSVDEVARLAAHLVVLERGRIQASGPVEAVLPGLTDPALGGEDMGALLSGQVTQSGAPWHLAKVTFSGGHVWVRDSGIAVGRPVRLRILARDVSISTAEPHQTSIQNQLSCEIESINADVHPSQALVRLRCGDAILIARITRRAVATLRLVPDMPVWAQVKSVALIE